MNTPAKSKSRFRFCTLAGVENVRLVESNKIAGRFKETLEEFDGQPKRRLIEDFLNWPSDPQSILRFTRKYVLCKTCPLSAKSSKSSGIRGLLTRGGFVHCGERKVSST